MGQVGECGHPTSHHLPSVCPGTINPSNSSHVHHMHRIIAVIIPHTKGESSNGGQPLETPQGLQLVGVQGQIHQPGQAAQTFTGSDAVVGQVQPRQSRL